MSQQPRGIGELPQQSIRTIVDKDGTKHQVSVWTPQHQGFLMDLREQILQMRQRLTIPDAPTNVKATAQAFSNLVQFTRSSDADYYEVLHSPTPSLKDPALQVSPIGNGASWVDHVGNAGVTVFYWVRARKNTGATSLEVGPAKATTLAAAAGVTPPTPPPPSNIIVTDQSTGRQIPYTLSSPRSFRL